LRRFFFDLSLEIRIQVGYLLPLAKPPVKFGFKHLNHNRLLKRLRYFFAQNDAKLGLTAGWVIGPMVGAWLAAATSLRAMLWMTALCALAQIIPLGTLKRGQVRPPIASRPQWSVLPPSHWHTMRPLLAFTGLYVLVYAGESVKYGFLPLYMDVQLHLGPAVRGA